MALWATRQSGGNADSRLNFTSLVPGDSLVLLDGTETIVSGSKSIAFSRADGMVGTDAGSSFQISGCAGGSVIAIQASDGTAESVMTFGALDLSFNQVGSVTGNGAYTDVGRSSFYRIVVTTLIGADVPVVIVKR